MSRSEVGRPAVSEDYLPSIAFLDDAVAESIEKFGQLIDLALEYLSLVGVAHTLASGGLLDHLGGAHDVGACLLYTSPSPRDGATSRMPSSA